jgi:serine/threonine protein phosphatase 1
MMKTFVIGDIHGRREQLDALLEMLPRDESEDTLVFLGDLVDRGPDAPGVVERVVSLVEENPEWVRCIRGNHEQMLLDFLDEGTGLWLTDATGGARTFLQYTKTPLKIESIEDFENARTRMRDSIPPKHVEFFRGLPLFHEDSYAIYVHAGLEMDKPPEETDARFLLWARDPRFFKHYTGKPCIFGHTPTIFLPLLGRIGRHGIYMSHSAVGIDTGYNYNSPLSCLSLPDFNLYQTYADGHSATHQITAFIPEELRALHRKSGTTGPVSAGHPLGIQIP